jgi:hypothetical protein
MMIVFDTVVLGSSACACTDDSEGGHQVIFGGHDSLQSEHQHFSGSRDIRIPWLNITVSSGTLTIASEVRNMERSFSLGIILLGAMHSCTQGRVQTCMSPDTRKDACSSFLECTAKSDFVLMYL